MVASAGHVSNGCVDADIIVNAQEVITTGEARKLRYGEGSPFLDIRLPCGGALDLFVVPVFEPSGVEAALSALKARASIGLRLSGQGLETVSDEIRTGWSGQAFEIASIPKLRLRIAGRGAEPAALAKLAMAADLDLVLQSPDEETLAAAQALGLFTQILVTPDAPPPVADDPWTAFVLMFHDHGWETGLLQQALDGTAFYIGALGSRTTHAKRLAQLEERGVAPDSLARINGPIGLIPAMRDASALAVSALAEVMQHWQETVF